MKRLISLAVIAVTVASAPTGCGSNATHPSPPSTTQQPAQVYLNWPPLLNDFRFHWSAEPGLDLTTGPGMVVRAYLEAYNVATYTFNLDNAYPGFVRATPENEKLEGNYLTQLVRIRPLNGITQGPRDARPHYGFVPFHLLQLTPVGDGYRAIVCTSDYAHFVASDVRPGKFVSLEVDQQTAQPYPASLEISVHRIEFTNHDHRVGSNPPAPVVGPQRGPAPAPDQDVFGDWFFTAAGSKYWGPINELESKDYPPDLERQCSDRMPQNEPERVAMMTGFKDQPPPHGEAIPGWPLDAN